MYKEIGSDFWIENTTLSPTDNLKGDYVLSGRTAWDLIIKDIKKKRGISCVYMPSWCCHSMLEPLAENRVDIMFYDLEYDGSLVYHIDNNASVDVLYITNYFGYNTNVSIEIVRRFKERGTIIVYDKTHSFLRKNDEYDCLANYSFASLRKCFSVISGAYITGLKLPSLMCYPFCEIREKAMISKYKYIKGEDTISKSFFLEAFSSFEEHLEKDYQNYAMDLTSKALLKQEDYELLRKKRRKNAEHIHNCLKGVSFLADFDVTAVPLFVPVIFESGEKRDRIKRVLIGEGIYCPVHWPMPNQVNSSLRVNQIYERELSLICDQRYDENDIHRMIRIINNNINH